MNGTCIQTIVKLLLGMIGNCGQQAKQVSEQLSEKSE